MIRLLFVLSVLAHCAPAFSQAVVTRLTPINQTTTVLTPLVPVTNGSSYHRSAGGWQSLPAPVPLTPIASSQDRVVRRTVHDCATGTLLYDSANPKMVRERYDAAVVRNYASWVRQNYWTWTKRQRHHDAVVIVSQGGVQGSGCLVWANKEGTLGLVATAAHVAQSEALHGFRGT